MLTMRNIFPQFLGLLCFLSSICSSAQEHEFGIWGGTMHSFGDINNSLNSLKYVEPAFGGFYRYNFNPRIAWYTGISAGTTFGEDATSTDLMQQARNLNYRTSVTEIATRIDFNFFPLDRNKPEKWFTPYVFIGINAFYFNPQALYNGSYVNLQPLGTEGQILTNNAYHRFQLGLPIGGGLKIALNKNFTAGIEVNWHKLFTDYFDDVSGVYIDADLLGTVQDGDLAVLLADRSTEIPNAGAYGESGKQRGDSKTNDAYMYTGVFISYSIVNLKCPPPGGKTRRK